MKRLSVQRRALSDKCTAVLRPPELSSRLHATVSFLTDITTHVICTRIVSFLLEIQCAASDRTSGSMEATDIVAAQLEDVHTPSTLVNLFDALKLVVSCACFLPFLHSFDHPAFTIIGHAYS